MTTGNIPCGIAIPQDLMAEAGNMQPIREFVARAETLNYDSLWIMESILGRTLELEPISLLSYVAGVTSKLRLGVSVMVLTLRNPIQLAKAAASLDFMSGGRFDMGIGMGHGQEALFGYAREGRVRRFEESLQVIKRLWTETGASHSGSFWSFENVTMHPRPVQKPHPPIWFGARHPNALRRAARYGDGFMGAGSSSIEDFKSQYGHLDRFLDEEGRDRESFRISKRVYVAIDDDKPRAERRLREWFGKRYGNADMGSRVSIWGGRDECLDRIGELVRAGAKHLLLNPVLDEMEHLVQLSEEIVPHL